MLTAEAQAGPEGDVLLVEDDELTADVIAEMLREIGYAHVLRAATVEDALLKLQGVPPRICVLDASLRGVPAYTVAAELKDSGIPFIVSTAYDPETLPGSFQYGVPLKKPYSRLALHTALEAALRHKRQGT